MKNSKLVLMAGVVLVSNIGFISDEGIYRGKSEVPQLYLTLHQRSAGNEQPQKEDSKYPERFPASLRGYDFRLSPKRTIKPQE